MYALRSCRQAGVALVMAMIVLVILTLLGAAAMRASRLQLRLSNNVQSRVNALQQAQSVADSVVGNSGNLQILPGTHYFSCYSAAAPYAVPSNPPSPQFSGGSCAASYSIGGTSYTNIGTLSVTVPSGTGASNPLPNNAYAQALRNDPEFVPTTAMRSAETSSRSYDFTSFTVIAGYDNSAPLDTNGNRVTASQPAAGAAEVVEGFYLRHSKVTGVTYQ